LEETFEFAAESRNLPGFRETLRPALAKAGLAEKTVGEVVLAVDEALTNVIRHAYEGSSGKIQVQFRDFPDRVEIVILDSGKRFDLAQVPEPELPPKKGGGLGVYFMKRLMDKVECLPNVPKGNRLILTKRK